jgi:hypothetical protein
MSTQRGIRSLPRKPRSLRERSTDVTGVARSEECAAGPKHAVHLRKCFTPVVKVLQHLRAHNHIERGLAKGRSESRRADAAQLDLEANLARAGLSAIQARYIDSDELDPVAKRNERPPKVERFGPSATDVQNAHTPGP